MNVGIEQSVLSQVPQAFVWLVDSLAAVKRIVL